MKIYQTLCGDYGGTRSGIVAAAIALFAERMGQTEYLSVIGGGEQKVVDQITKRGTIAVNYSSDIIETASEVDRDWAEHLTLVRRSAVTPEQIIGSDLMLLVDRSIMLKYSRNYPSANLNTMLGYIGHSREPTGMDLDDANWRGSLDKFAAIKIGMPQAEADEKAKRGEFLYHAPFGGDYPINSPEAGKAEMDQLYILGRVLTQKLAEDAYQWRKVS